MEKEIEKLKLIIKDRKPKKGEELIEIAEKVRALKDILGTSELARRLEVSNSIISDFDRIARIEPEIKKLISNSGLGLRAIRIILTLDDKQVISKILNISAKVSFSESEVEEIVSCCKKGISVEECIDQILRKKPRLTYVLISRRLPHKVVNMLKTIDVNIIKDVINKYTTANIDDFKIENDRIILTMKSEAYRRIMEKAAIENLSEIDLIIEILERELKIT
jgi:hypothetical protein